jgi:hypothetical protein
LGILGAKNPRLFDFCADCATVFSLLYHGADKLLYGIFLFIYGNFAVRRKKWSKKQGEKHALRKPRNNALGNFRFGKN